MGVPVRTRAGAEASPVPAEMTIGEVLARLRGEFPDVTVSKIRFLEGEGLVEPRRSASGYRKFGPADLDRLRYVLTAQRDHYLPLRVIKDHLDAIDRGLVPPALGLPGPRVPRTLAGPAETVDADAFATAGDVRLSRAELLEASGLVGEVLSELESFGLVRAGVGGYFDEDSLTVARTVAELSAYGLQPRHLRPYKTAADREIGLIEQLVAPLVAHRPAQAAEVARTVAALSQRLHAALVRSALRAVAAR